ncbi:hypothetical protein, partial [Xanthovirga aplysinae]|uniref:hypothetical protein n=1 Tax=Xanthovirga aplysinae TaxID=2529853 RepID=UPI001CA4258D
NSLTFNGNTTTTGALSFGSSKRQMINLWNTNYGIGIQSSTQYYRTAAHFAWFRGGSHSDSGFDPGSGGSVMMVLNDSGNLGIGTTSPSIDLAIGDSDTGLQQ